MGRTEGLRETQDPKMSSIDIYLRNNARYAAGFSHGDLPAEPAGRVAIVACMDSRLDTSALLGISEGDAHVIRNAGGVVTDDVIRSLVISQRLKSTREIMLIHHTDCGALAFTDSEIKDAIEEETGTRPGFAMEAFTDLEDDVRRSIARLEASPFLPYRDEIRGFVYDVDTGRLREVD
jgi:carbonic anhydrase